MKPEKKKLPPYVKTLSIKEILQKDRILSEKIKKLLNLHSDIEGQKPNAK